jgi:glycogen(starch) synthase
VLRLCSVFEPPASALAGRAARFDPVGGMQEHTGSLTRALADRGVVQVVLTTRPPSAPWIERIAPGATVVRVALPVRRPRQLYSLPAATLAPLLGSHADLIHAHLGEDLAILPLAALAALPRRLAVVVTVHCSLSHTLAVGDARSALLHVLGGAIERWGERRAAATIVMTERLAQRLADDPRAGEVRVINRGIDHRAFIDPGPDPFPQVRGRPRVVFIGRIVWPKGPDTLIRAFARLQTPGVRLLLVGDGPERARCERLARQLGVAERIHVSGFIAHDRVPAVLASADLLVLPSVYEELGTVLVEALHAGLPVIASRVGGIPEVVGDGETGLLVPPGDPGALAHAIDTVLGDPELARRLGANGRRRAPRYELDGVAGQVAALYSELIAERPEPVRRRSGVALGARFVPPIWPP